MIESYGVQKGTFAACFIARAISIVCSFPFEYKYTANMAVETKQESKTIGKGSITTGLTQTASRNMIKTLMFMQLYENCCVQFKKLEWF